jgi:hypothetical protein
VADHRPLYGVFADESIPHGPCAGFRVQGGVWIRREAAGLVRARFSWVREKFGHDGELKWEKIGGQRLHTGYARLSDLFLEASSRGDVSFNSIVIQHGLDPTFRRSSAEQELGFYKAYFTLFRHRLAPGSDNYLRLHQTTSARVAPEEDLKDCLNAAARRDLSTPFLVRDCKLVDAKDDFIQLADVLCGAVAWEWNGRSPSPAKLEFYERLCSGLERGALRETPPSESRFNVWRYEPRATTDASKTAGASAA